MTDQHIKDATFGHILGAMTALNIVLWSHIIATLAARGGVWWAP